MGEGKKSRQYPTFLHNFSWSCGKPVLQPLQVLVRRDGYIYTLGRPSALQHLYLQLGGWGCCTLPPLGLWSCDRPFLSDFLLGLGMKEFSSIKGNKCMTQAGIYGDCTRRQNVEWATNICWGRGPTFEVRGWNDWDFPHHESFRSST